MIPFLKQGLAIGTSLASGLLLFGVGDLACEQTAQAQTPTPAASRSETVPSAPARGSEECVECHQDHTPGIVQQYLESKHARSDVECLDCHGAQPGDLDGWEHEGSRIATIVTPKDCGECHEDEFEEFEGSHHAAAGNILHSLDNLLAEVLEGSRKDLVIPDPHRPGHTLTVNGASFANSGCHQCHGSQIALQSTDGGSMTPWRLVLPEGGGKAKVSFDASLVDAGKIARDEHGEPLFDSKTWPNTGIGRMNLDGSRGSCTACHSRHDFSARRARQPENCGKCHLGPDHPQKEIYEESKHGIAYRDRKDEMNLDSPTWVVGEDYTAAPTCATCHMSATKNQEVTHDPRARIAWNNRPPASVRMDTDAQGKITQDPAQVTSTWQDKRAAMTDVCINCHGGNFVKNFFKQYDDFVLLYNTKFAQPGLELMASLKSNGLLSKKNFDETIEWTWFFIWHHEGRRGRHGASMMAPDYAHWHGTFEVADRWYNEFLPEARRIIDEAKADPAKRAGALAAEEVLDGIIARDEHQFGGANK